MARLRRVESSRKPHTCGTREGPHPIPVGEGYYYWQPRYGPRHVRCFKHRPRQSEMTTSKMAEVYAAQEDLQEFNIVVLQELEEEQSDADRLKVGKERAEEVLEDAMNRAQEVADEYEAAIEAMPASEGQNREYIDQIEAWIQELEQHKDQANEVELGDDPDALENATNELVEIVHNAAETLEA